MSQKLQYRPFQFEVLAGEFRNLKVLKPDRK